MSRDLQVLRVKREEMGFLAEMGSQGLEGCQVLLGLEGRPGQGAHLEPLDQKDPLDRQAPVVQQDCQEGEVFQARLAHRGLQALQVPQHQPVPASQNRTTIVEKTLSSPTPSTTLEGYLFQDLRGLPGLLVPQVLKARQDLLVQQDKMENLECMERRAPWGQRENVGREDLQVTRERGA